MIDFISMISFILWEKKKKKYVFYSLNYRQNKEVTISIIQF